MSFKLIKKSKNSKARLGQFHTAHGVIMTPAFFPVATQAAVKGLSTKELEEIGVSGLLVNAYHLYLRPGLDVIQNLGGLHKFMGFTGPIITDSGGYQVFSLQALRKVIDEGVEFQSHIDGSFHFLRPQDIMNIQLALGADIIVPLDQCLKLPADKAEASSALRRTLKWARISKEVFDQSKKNNILFFGIIQGATFADLRKQCIEELLNIGVDGFAIGGLSVGESLDIRLNILDRMTDNLEDYYLRYFMGYGKPFDIIEAVDRGVDLFDCVFPTRVARSGTAFSNLGKVVVRNSSYSEDSLPIDKNCTCYVCRTFSRAYLRHLVNAREILGAQLLTYHNIFWYNNFMEKIRQAIEEDRFPEFKQEFISQYKENNPDGIVIQ